MPAEVPPECVVTFEGILQRRVGRKRRWPSGIPSPAQVREGVILSFPKTQHILWALSRVVRVGLLSGVAVAYGPPCPAPGLQTKQPLGASVSPPWQLVIFCCQCIITSSCLPSSSLKITEQPLKQGRDRSRGLYVHSQTVRRL